MTILDLSCESLHHIVSFLKFSCEQSYHDVSTLVEACFSNYTHVRTKCCDLHVIFYIAAMRKDLREYVYYQSSIYTMKRKLFSVKEVPFSGLPVHAELERLFVYIYKTNNLTVAGGFTTQLFMNPSVLPKFSSDIDIYVLKSDTVQAIELLLFLKTRFTIKDILVKSREYDPPNFIYNIIVKEIPYILQIIITSFENPLQVIDDYDYSHNKIALYKEKMYAMPCAISTHKTKVSFNLHSFWYICRIQKCINNGFSIFGLDDKLLERIMEEKCCEMEKTMKYSISYVETITAMANTNTNKLFSSHFNYFTSTHKMIPNQSYRKSDIINHRITYCDNTTFYCYAKKMLPFYLVFNARYYDMSLDGLNTTSPYMFKEFNFTTKDDLSLYMKMSTMLLDMHYSKIIRSHYTRSTCYHDNINNTDNRYNKCKKCLYDIVYNVIVKDGEVYRLRCHNNGMRDKLIHGTIYTVRLTLQTITPYFYLEDSDILKESSKPRVNNKILNNPYDDITSDSDSDDDDYEI